MYKIQPKTLFIGKNIIYLPSCHSTNDKASELLQTSSVLEGTVVITDNQTAGRGQRGNIWKTTIGQNLTFSIILKPHFLQATEQFWLNIAVSLGVHDFLSSYLGLNMKIKWPNDLYYKSKKLGGILIENNVQKTNLQSSIIGIGLNINQVNFEQLNATSLAQVTGQIYDLEMLFPELLEGIEKRYLQLRAKNYTRLKFDYLRHFFWYQEQQYFEINGECVAGMIMGVDEAGQLIVNIENQLQVFDFQKIKYLIW